MWSPEPLAFANDARLDPGSPAVMGSPRPLAVRCVLSTVPPFTSRAAAVAFHHTFHINPGQKGTVTAAPVVTPRWTALKDYNLGSEAVWGTEA